jgi:hypothetical protein
MQRMHFLTMAAALLMGSAAMGVDAQSLTVTRATIPFEFVADGKTMPAGKYLFEKSPYQHVISMQNPRGEAFLLAGVPLSKPGETANPRLVFFKQGGKYVLSQAWIRGDGLGQQFAAPPSSPGAVHIALNLQ